MTTSYKTALISVYHKEGLLPILQALSEANIQLISTGGTAEFIQQAGYAVTQVESLTGFPSIFGGRVKTLHPAVMGGILFRREEEKDLQEKKQYNIPSIDVVIVDLYPFEETVLKTSDEAEIIEKIDIGGISLIRAAAKNFADVLIVPSREYYAEFLKIITDKTYTTEAVRKRFAGYAFGVSSHYDTAIARYFSEVNGTQKKLRYGENPHQSAVFFGDTENYWKQLHGKELSYNNLVDMDAAVALMQEFDETVFVIVKHTNACGVATATTTAAAYQRALQCDPISAFGGVLATNGLIDEQAATLLHTLFFEILIAPDFSPEALKILTTKKNRILIKQTQRIPYTKQTKSILGGLLEQEVDTKVDAREDLQMVTNVRPNEEEIKTLLFASKICKHTKSNAIVLAKDGAMLSSGVGQTSRIDALEQAISKAKRMGFDLQGASMASDAFFPFPDCVMVAHQHGIRSVIQPGGSINDKDSISFCNGHNMSMVVTGFRHFKH